MDQHNDGTGNKFAALEQQLEKFIERFDEMTAEMADIKAQQEALINLVKEQLLK